MSKTTEPPKIGILGPFGYGNLGDAAIQQAMIQHICKYFPQAQIIAFSMNPKDTESRHHVKAFPLTRELEEDLGDDIGKNKNVIKRLHRWFKYHPNARVRKIEQVFVRLPLEFVLFYRAYQNVKGLDLLMVSGGGQFDDLWGGPWKHPYALYKFTLLAKLRKINVIIVSVGFERAQTFFGRYFLKNTIRRACYRSYRDTFSKQELARLGLNPSPESRVYPDLAHSLEIKVEPGQKVYDPAHPVVGLNIVSYFDPKFWPLKDPVVYQEYLSKIVVFMEWLLKTNHKIILIRSDIYLDMNAIADAMALLHQKGVVIPPGMIVEPDINTVDDLMESLSAADFVVASRLHTVLLTIRVNKPVLALSFQRKTDMLMQNTGLSAYCLPIREFTSETLVHEFLGLKAKHAELSAQIAQRSLEFRTLLDEQYEHIFKLVKQD